MSHNSAVLDDHERCPPSIDDGAFAGLDELRRHAREAVQQAQKARGRAAAAHRERMLIEELEATAHELDGLRAAMATRATIEQAKGVLMGLRGCSPEEAFQDLVRLSQSAQRKLHDVASLVVAEARHGRFQLQTPDPQSSAMPDR